MKRLLPLFLLPLLLGSTGAHLGVRSSMPARGDTIRTALDSIAITFTQPVELRFTHITLTNARGDSLPGALRSTGDRSVVLELPQLLNDGAYIIAWRTAGADGHVVQGTIPFTVVGFPAFVPDSAKVDMIPVPTAAHDPNVEPTAVVLRWLNFAAILLMIGCAVFVLLLRTQSLVLPVTFAESAWKSARTIGIVVAIGGLVVLIPRLLMQAAALGSTIHPVLSTTNWGRGWMLQALGTLGFVTSVVAADALDADAWKLAFISVMILAFGPAFAGHAAAIENLQIISISADAVHVFAASAWLGTLVYILLAGIPAAKRTGEHQAIASTVRLFSPIALISAAAAAFTGSVSAFAHLGSVTQLWTTSYGSMLLRKLIAVALTALVGLYNWRRVRPRLGETAGTERLQRSAIMEVAIVVIVLLVTAILVALPTP
jgi:copper transport protein